MRYAELKPGLMIQLDNEEVELYKRLRKSKSISADELSERDIVILDRLVIKNLAKRHQEAENVLYTRRF